MPRMRSQSSGAVMVEFAIVFPLLIFLVAGIANVGSILSQTQHMTTSVRYGARSASLTSSAIVTCAAIVEKAKADAAANYTEQSPPPGQKWEINDGTSGVITSTDPDVVPAIRVIKVVGQAKNEDNCIFCFQNYLRKILPEVQMIAPLGGGCL